MATSMHGVTSQSCATHPIWDLEDERILIDIETSYQMAVLEQTKSRAVVPMDRILHGLRDGRTLGPLSVLLILVVYTLLSPHLPAAFHEYVYHILH